MRVAFFGFRHSGWVFPLRTDKGACTPRTRFFLFPRHRRGGEHSPRGGRRLEAGEGREAHERLGRRAGRRADVSDNGSWLGRWRAAVSYAFVALLVGGCAPQSDRGVVTHEGRRQRDVALDIDGPPGRSVEISEFVFESGPVSSRVKGRAIVTA